ncbi:MAG: precorrin-3B C(17)-methyltransferase [Lachnospiraceae bacterium]|nr:precorrin-3B C(17)-methyltransferase [Lachnospiraceae bacterium]
MSRIYVVGIGPGDESMMTHQAMDALRESDVIIGYRSYTDLVKERFPGKEIIESSMRQERERCRKCIELAAAGRTVALICSGDAGVYGMASPLIEEAAKRGYDDIVIVPGVTAALSGAAMLGAPIGHDFCTISLSDLLTPWEIIEKRLRLAAEADFCIAIYNPASRGRADYLKRACDVLLELLPPDRVCGYAKNIGRSESSRMICTLSELAGIDAGMSVTVFVGNSMTYSDGKRMITPRGYRQ